MTLRRYAVVAVLALLAGALLNAPAALLWAWLQPKSPPPKLQLAGLAGTLDEGRASALLWNGQALVSDVAWDLRPWWLLAARLQLHLEGGAAPALLSGDVGFVPGGRVTFSHLQLNSAVKPLLAAAGLPLPWLAGQATADFARLKLRRGVPVDAQGKLLLQSLSWGLGRDPIALGDFAADFAPQGDDIVATLATVAGPMDLTGEGRIAADASYELRIRFKPRPDAPPPVQNLVHSAGAPDVEGYYHIERRGSFAPPVAAPAAAVEAEPEE
jgi:hypothetical protein